MWFVFPFYLLVASGFLVVTGGYLVVTSGYLIATTGYFWFLVLVTSTKSLILLEPRIWEIVPDCIKTVTTLRNLNWK